MYAYVEVRVFALNVAIAASAILILTMILIHKSRWALPTRHAVLVSALMGCIVVPVLIQVGNRLSWGLIHVPDAQAFSQRRMSDESKTPNRLSDSLESNSTKGRFIPTNDASTTAGHPDDSVGISLDRDFVSEGQPIGRERDKIEINKPSNVTLSLWLLSDLLIALWLVGIGMSLGLRSWTFIQSQRLLRTAQHCQNEMILGAIRIAMRQVGNQRPLRVYMMDSIPVPFVVGWLRPCIVVPCDLHECFTTKQLVRIFKHETAHIQRHDTWVGLIQQVATAIYWWNPLVWKVSDSISEVREQICDDIAINDIEFPDRREDLQDYVGSLIEFCERAASAGRIPVAAVGIALPPMSQIEKRIRRLLSTTENRVHQMRRTSILTIFAASTSFGASLLFAQINVGRPTESSDSTRLNQSQDLKRAGNAEVANDANLEPSGAVLRLGTRNFRHSDFVSRISYSPDGRFIASISREVYLWNSHDGKLLGVLNPKSSDCPDDFCPINF